MWSFLLLFCFSLCLSLSHTTEPQNKSPNFGSDEKPNQNGSFNSTDSNNTENPKRKSLNENDVCFTLYTRQIPDGIKIEAQISIYSSLFYLTKPTKFITHGWLAQGVDNNSLRMKDEFLKKYDAYVFIVDWHKLAENIFYGPVVYQIKDVAEQFSDFLNELVNLGVKPDHMHLVGHSLGAHVSGFAARGVKMGKVARITGLDPASFGFNTESKLDRLSYTDAEFVDVIHTSGDFLGLMQPIGDVDFYPYGGRAPQPGCPDFLPLGEPCSHSMSWSYFIDNLVSPQQYFVKKCNSVEEFPEKSKKKELCKGTALVMGDSVPVTTRGIYYLTSGVNDAPLGNQSQDIFSSLVEFINQ